MKYLEIVQKALKQIASCEMKVKGDVVDIAQQTLPALQAHEAEVKELVEALEMALQISDGCSRGALGAFQQKANAILAKVKP